MDIQNRTAYQNLIKLGRSPAEAEIELMERPRWDDFWMGMAFYFAMRSPDSQTKQGCLIVDWESKTLIGSGYSGHIAGVDGLPTYRSGTKLLDGTIQGKPDKYDFIIHADENALGRVFQRSDYAVMYVTMTPCERCIGQALNSPLIKLRRVVFFEERDFQLTEKIVNLWNEKNPWKNVQMDLYGATARKEMDAHQTLIQAARYLELRREAQHELGEKATRSYRDLNTSHEAHTPDSNT